jgi:hypothetical protein
LARGGLGEGQFVHAQSSAKNPMELQKLALRPSVFKVEPAPVWYVSNGDLTVGPVVTPLLMRGIEHGRIPEYCLVKPLGSSRAHSVRDVYDGWRGLSGVREVAALYGTAPTTPFQTELAEWPRMIDLVRDEDELCHTATWLSLVATGAESAMLHCRGRHGRTLFTRTVLGSVSSERLGQPLPENDWVLKSARRGVPVQGPPYGPAEDALAIRFASSEYGVGASAMIPVTAKGDLIAMLELSRPGHAFRRSDLQRAERIVQYALNLRWN